MIDLNAPIIPGIGAAGIRLGSKIQEILHDTTVSFQVEEIGTSGIVRYRSPDVDLWEKGGVVHQIMIHGQYKGVLLGKIKLGSTVDDVRTFLGDVRLDEEDNLIIDDIPGLCFEIDVDRAPSTIIEIYVFEP